MFRVKRAAEGEAILWMAFGILASIVVAGGMTAWLIVEVRKEQRILSEIVHGGIAEDIRGFGTLPGELRWQLVFTVLVALVLVVSAVGLLFVVRAYLASHKSLRDVKILSWDILASMDHGVITTNRTGQITSLNPRGQELLDVQSECMGRELDEICSEGVPLAEMSRDVASSGNAQYDREFTVVRRGHDLRLRAECHLLRDTDGQVLGTVLHVRDVTERVLIEERMRRMERFIGLGTLASGLHHEIKNPLSALSLHVQLLEEKLGLRADEDIAENLGVLKTEVTRISGVLDSFRDYASVERLDRKETDLCHLTRQTLSLIGPKAQQQHVQVELKLPGSKLPPVSADPARLEQVLLNLVLNALEEMRDGGTLTLAAGRGEEHVFLSVADTGRGIPNNVRSRIFDPYFTTKNHGSGMGLAVSDKIIRLHGGQIDVETGSAGSKFRITLPMDHDDGREWPEDSYH